jgi:hypothetical protein
MGSKKVGTWVTKVTEGVAVERGYDNLAQMADELDLNFDEVWLMDGDNETEDVDGIVEVGKVISVVDFINDRVYEIGISVDVLKKEVGDFGNERLFFEGVVDF